MLALIIIAFLWLGLVILMNLIFVESNPVNFTTCLWMAFGLYAIELAAHPTNDGRKSDLKLLLFLFVFVIIATIIIGLFLDKLAITKLIVMCVLFPIFAFGIYFAMLFYEKWNVRRKKKNNVL